MVEPSQLELPRHAGVCFVVGEVEGKGSCDGVVAGGEKDCPEATFVDGYV